MTNARQSPFAQSYIVVMNDGRVMQWTGLAPGFERGQELAEAKTRAHCKCDVWASCNAPIHGNEPHGIIQLKGV